MHVIKTGKLTESNDIKDTTVVVAVISLSYILLNSKLLLLLYCIGQSHFIRDVALFPWHQISQLL